MATAAATPLVVETRASIRTPLNVYHTIPITATDTVRDLIERVAWIENTEPSSLVLFRKKRTTAADGREFEDREDLDPSHRIAEYQIVYEREPLYIGNKTGDYVIVTAFSSKDRREVKLMCDYIDSTLGDLRRAISIAFGLPETRFRLILNRSDLKDDNKRLVEFGLGGQTNKVFLVEKKEAEAA